MAHPFDDSEKSLRDLASEVVNAEEALDYWRGLRNRAIVRRLEAGATWDDVQSEAGVSRATVSAARRAAASA